MAFARVKAWKEIFKLAKTRNVQGEVNEYFRNNIIQSLTTMGWFDFLKSPRTVNEIIAKFGVKDPAYLEDIFKTLTSDDTITQVAVDKYQCNGHHSIKPNVDPKVFNASIKQLLWNYAEFIPKKLVGEDISFSGGINLFDWDDALSLFMYQQIRKAAFAYVNPLKSPCKFLDIGCGNGTQTAGMWLDCLKRNLFKGDNPTQLHGIEIDKGLLDIAQNEFVRLVRKQSEMSEEEVLTYKKFFPKFSWGNIIQIPYPDNTFDYVYASQVIHWTDPIVAIKELYRVLRPNGIAFGTESFLGGSDLYTNLHVKVIKGAYGFFTKEDMTKWAKLAGFKTISYTTPTTIFKFIK